MQRFFLPELTPKEDQVVSLAPIHSQLRRVLRVQPGSQVIVLDNAGSERLLQVESIERRDTLARVMEVRAAPAESTVAMTLYQCVLKGDKFELVLQKATELGATTVVPVVSSRTVARPRALGHKLARWATIVREAAEQCGRGALPVVAPPCTFAEAIAAAQGTRLLPWEEGESDPGLLSALQQATQPVSEISLLIGPEGGLEADEVGAAVDAGWRIVTLGQRILRAETAALASLTLVSAALGWMGDAATVKVASGTPVKSQNGAQAAASNAAASTTNGTPKAEAEEADKGSDKQDETAAKKTSRKKDSPDKT